MTHLANLFDTKDKKACLARGADEYKPVKDAVAHTALLADLAKSLTTAHNVSPLIDSIGCVS